MIKYFTICKSRFAFQIYFYSSNLFYQSYSCPLIWREHAYFAYATFTISQKVSTYKSVIQQQICVHAYLQMNGKLNWRTHIPIIFMTLHASQFYICSFLCLKAPCGSSLPTLSKFTLELLFSLMICNNLC